MFFCMGLNPADLSVLLHNQYILTHLLPICPVPSQNRRKEAYSLTLSWKMMPAPMQWKRRSASAWWSGCVHTTTSMTRRYTSAIANWLLHPHSHAYSLYRWPPRCWAMRWVTILPLTLKRRAAPGSSSAFWTLSWCYPVLSISFLCKEDISR